MFSVIYNMYKCIKSRIVHNANVSEYFSCNVGLRQGENLSPFLFSLYLNDLEEFMYTRNVIGLESVSRDLEDDLNVFLKLFILLYADDTVLFSESINDLQLQLNVFWFVFVVFAGRVFQQTVGIPMGTNCAPLLADIFLYSYEADFIQSLLSTGKKHLASRFNLTYRYIDDVLSINNPEFENYLGQMYPAELEIKDTTESTTSAFYLDLLLSIGRDGQLHTSIYDKRDDFNFHITKFPFLSSNIPSSPAYGVFISQLIRYARACSSYECFILRARRLSSKLLKQGYLVERLKSSFRKFYGRYGDLIEQYGVTLSRMLNDILTLDQQ